VNTIPEDAPTGRARRTYSASFKAELVEQCRHAGVSLSAVAISNGMNPNVLRRWIKETHGSGVAMAPRTKSLSVDVQSAFVAVPMSATATQAANTAPAGVRIEIQRNGATVSVMWPASHLRESGAWVRDILR